eukprot:12922032-Prorocentrum_lima.AAC.1
MGRCRASANDVRTIPSMSAHSSLDIGSGAMPGEERAPESCAAGSGLGVEGHLLRVSLTRD